MLSANQLLDVDHIGIALTVHTEHTEPWFMPQYEEGGIAHHLQLMWRTIYTNQLNNFRKQPIVSWLIKRLHKSVENYLGRFRFGHFVVSLSYVPFHVNSAKFPAFIHHCRCFNIKLISLKGAYLLETTQG